MTSKLICTNDSFVCSFAVMSKSPERYVVLRVLAGVMKAVGLCRPDEWRHLASTDYLIVLDELLAAEDASLAEYVAEDLARNPPERVERSAWASMLFFQFIRHPFPEPSEPEFIEDLIEMGTLSNPTFQEPSFQIFSNTICVFRVTFSFFLLL